MTTPTQRAIRRALASHGVTATLVRAGVSYDGESDTREAVKVLKRSYEGAETDGATGMETRKARWMLPAEDAPFVPKPYDRLEIGDYVITIHRVDPKYADGAIVRYDLEVAG